MREEVVGDTDIDLGKHHRDVVRKRKKVVLLM